MKDGKVIVIRADGYNGAAILNLIGGRQFGKALGIGMAGNLPGGSQCFWWILHRMLCLLLAGSI
jgi:hypothetical protein